MFLAKPSKTGCAVKFHHLRRKKKKKEKKTEISCPIRFGSDGRSKSFPQQCNGDRIIQYRQTTLKYRLFNTIE